MRVTTCCALVSLAVVLGAATAAQGQSPFIGMSSLEATCNGNNVDMTFRVMVQHYSTGHPELVGFDLYRRVAEPCGPDVRLTDTPWPRDFSADFTRSLHDTGIVVGTMYKYSVVGVDANRQPVAEFDRWYDTGSFFTTWTGCGTSFLSHGTLQRYDQGGWIWVQSCADACLLSSFMETWPAEIEQYANTNTAVRLFGTLVCGTTEGCLLHVSSFEVDPCMTIGVESRPWSSVKSLYR